MPGCLFEGVFLYKSMGYTEYRPIRKKISSRWHTVCLHWTLQRIKIGFLIWLRSKRNAKPANTKNKHPCKCMIFDQIRASSRRTTTDNLFFDNIFGLLRDLCNFKSFFQQIHINFMIILGDKKNSFIESNPFCQKFLYDTEYRIGRFFLNNKSIISETF